MGIGSVVTIRLNGQTKALTIVGHDEADPSQDRIAYAAPLARALMGASARTKIHIRSMYFIINLRPRLSFAQNLRVSPIKQYRPEPPQPRQGPKH